MVQPAVFHARVIDDDPRLLEQSYRLRYQVYCLERGFLDPGDYPDGREIDEFDPHSVHLAVLDTEGAMIGTARLIKANPRGFPMFRHCAFFPEVMPPDAPHRLVEGSRLAIRRHYMRRRRSTEPLCDLMKALVMCARGVGANHLIAASEPALARRLAQFGFPYRIGGPTADYFGPVAACLMDLDEFDEVVAGGQYPSLHRTDSVWTPALSRGADESALATSLTPEWHT
jgi:N-acyl-L-homoserine lactone synthetase